ncbi:hypothetical protein GCK32_009152 [Trichostrongylus colubriformis]|uniref:Transmembrane protein n=1 Tax=Trichostrongylus colubriformis TaxID=6319 RepID=A0AAN8IHH4_TRICO
MLFNDASAKHISLLEFLVGFFTSTLAVLFIFYGFSLRADVRPQSVTSSSLEFQQCFNEGVSDHLVDSDLRVVLVLIDAWRMSFLSDSDSPMVFLRDSITSGRGVVFKANVQIPTVTMPRIKVEYYVVFA